MYHRLATIVLSAALAIAATAEIPPGADIHLFGSLNKAVVAVGEPFIYEVEAYALVESTEQAEELSSAFERMVLVDGGPDPHLIRMEPTEKSIETLDEGQLVARVSRRLVFRTAIEGPVYVPEITIDWLGRRSRLAGRRLNGYRTRTGFHDAARAIVPLFVERKDTARQRSYQRTGTGFFIRHDALVTSFHVVAEAKRVHVMLPDGSHIESRDVWSIDPIRDVAILHVDPERVRAAAVRPLVLAGTAPPSTTLHPAGSSVVFSFGWPGGVRRSTAGEIYPEARLGFDRIWISSNGVRPGDSGGPLLTTRGEVLGVVTLGTAGDVGPDALRENVCIANDPRPAIAQMSLSLGTRSLRSVFRQRGFRDRPYVQAFRILAMITRRERFDESLRNALTAFESAVEDRQRDPGLHFMRGMLYKMLGTEREANASFEEVLEIYGGFFPASYLLGLDHLEKREYADAIEHFEQTLRVEPYRHLAEFGLARAMIGTQDYESALTLLRRVLAFDPYFAPALYQTALCHLALGNRSDVLLTSVRLSHVSRRWQRQLRQVMENPVLQPHSVIELPRATIAPLALSH